jgi:hypothetical protein
MPGPSRLRIFLLDAARPSLVAALGGGAEHCRDTPQEQRCRKGDGCSGDQDQGELEDDHDRRPCVETAVEIGAPGETRTHDLQVRNLTLYPLSYGRIVPLREAMAEREGFEPSKQVTPLGGLANRCTRPLCDLSAAQRAES